MEEFRKWQRKFYRSREWETMRDMVRQESKMRCRMCGKLIRGKSIVDHIKAITPQNKNDLKVTLSIDNLQLLCLECHNAKHAKNKFDFELEKRKDINLIPPCG